MTDAGSAALPLRSTVGTFMLRTPCRFSKTLPADQQRWWVTAPDALLLPRSRSDTRPLSIGWFYSIPRSTYAGA
jgi:hypothetical protein